MTRKLFFSVSLFLVLCVGIFLFCQTAIAVQSDIIDSGTCGKNLTWSLNSEGTLTISGTGPMYEYPSFGNSPWYKNCLFITTAIIEDGVTTIGKGAFYGCYSLTSITIGRDVTSIGTIFHSGNSILKIVNHSSLNLEFESDDNGGIARNAKVIVAPDGTKNYLSEAWVETSDGFLFYTDNGQYTLRAYLGAEFTITLPQDFNGNKYNIFEFRGCHDVIIPAGATTVDNHAFEDCFSLTSIVLPDGITQIGLSAFSECSSLVTIDIPDSVQRIASGAFYECSSLTAVYIPDGITRIEKIAFSRCDSLTSITLPDSVTYIADCAFWESSNIETINIPSGVTYIGKEAFKDCRSLRGDFYIPDGVTSIQYGTFAACDSMSSITIPDSVTSIGGWAFGSSGLTNLIIPESVTSIGAGAFSDCGSLWHVLYEGTELQWNAIAIDDGNNYLNNATRHYNCTGDEVTDLENKVCTVCAANCTHEWKIEQITKEPTCYEDGAGVYKCVLCGDTKTDAVASSGHNFGRWTQTKAPTCLDKGKERRECANCEEYEEREVKATGHSYKEEITKATCTEGGYTTYTCSSCGDAYVGDQVPAHGHNWDDATCTAPKTCSTCYATEGSALGHSWDDGVTNEDTTVSYTCIVCGEVKTEGTPVSPTEPTEPSTEPTDPAIPSTEPTEPSTAPIDPTQSQTQPLEQPTKPIQTEPLGTGDATPIPQEKNDSTILIVIIAIVCLGGGAIVLVLLKKKF